MYQRFILFVLVLILASFVSNDNLYLLNLSLFKSAFAISTDQTAVVLSTWPIATNSANITSVISDYAGNVYLIESNASKIGRLVPATNTFTEWFITYHPLASENIWALPAKPGKLTGVAFDPAYGNIYFGESNPNKIGRLAPATNTFTEWSIASHPLAISVNPGGNCFFAEDIGRLGRLG
jgi:streptogramin lyase